jgi:hypothetical protein
MAFPVGWPPRLSPNVRPLRFFVEATSTANFSDRAYLFGTDPTTGQPTQAGNVDQLPVVPHGAEQQVVNLQNPPIGGSGPSQGNTVIPMRYADSIQISNDSLVAGDTIQISFDGTNIHGEIPAGETRRYRDRQEAGIAVRTKPLSGNCAFRLEAW